MGNDVNSAGPRAPQEAPVVSLTRAMVRGWPLPRGRGVLLRLARALLGNKRLVLQIDRDVHVEGTLDDYASVYYFIHGYGNDPTFRLVFDLMQPGDTVFDVGANRGWFAIPAARRVGSGGRIEAFEPQPDILRELAVNVALNRLEGVRLHGCALADSSGARGFQADPANSVRGAFATAVTNDTIDVEVTTLDEHCARHAIERVDWLKIDVEGAESLVIAGAQRLLASPGAPAIMFEVGDTLAARFASSSATVKQMLAAHGYSILALCHGRLRPVPLAAPHPNSTDLLAFTARHFEARPGLLALLDDGV